ncbi:MAG: hypothetical protein VB032_05585 [Burkholderiaceae bacterium]|nr:hypothetical protein [Burkholderiaceae bacterium]
MNSVTTQYSALTNETIWSTDFARNERLACLASLQKPPPFPVAIVNSLVGLGMSSLHGAITETRQAWRLHSHCWQDFIVHDLIRYFAPVTGAVRGFRAECRRLGLRIFSGR